LVFRSGLQLVFGNVFEIKLVEMGKPAVPAPDGKVPAADGQVMGTGNMAVPAFGRLDKLPEIITTNPCERSLFTDILDTGYENPGGTAVLARHLCLVRYSLDNLVGNFFAIIAVGTVPCEDETFAHVKIVDTSGLINLLLWHTRRTEWSPSAGCG
jgi:hypothetical protein